MRRDNPTSTKTSDLKLALTGVGKSPDMVEHGKAALHVRRHVNDDELQITGPATDDRHRPEFMGMF